MLVCDLFIFFNAHTLKTKSWCKQKKKKTTNTFPPHTKIPCYHNLKQQQKKNEILTRFFSPKNNNLRKKVSKERVNLLLIKLEVYKGSKKPEVILMFVPFYSPNLRYSCYKYQQAS